MLIAFFVIVFIAEVIVTLKIIEWIIRCDNIVCTISSQFVEYNQKIENTFIDLRITINSVLLNLNKVQVKIEGEKNKFKNKVLKYAASTLLFLLLNNNGKRIFSTIELIISIIGYVKLYIKKVKLERS